VSTVHSPFHLARSMATLDQLSGGQVDVGIGTGGPQREFAAFGIDADHYIARFTERLALMKALWTQIAKRLYIGVDDNAARARDRMRAAIAHMYGRPWPAIEAAAVAGTPAECADAVARTAAAGAELILFTTLFEPGLQAARLADEVITLLG
jgi:alkanesulfonate monooxygenase SsuD/methylene tetrahydromethanopterin reductase-like flavin-dependent oxidoreductase (luciferase family)